MQGVPSLCLASRNAIFGGRKKSQYRWDAPISLREPATGVHEVGNHKHLQGKRSTYWPQNATPGEGRSRRQWK